MNNMALDHWNRKQCFGDSNTTSIGSRLTLSIVYKFSVFGIETHVHKTEVFCGIEFFRFIESCLYTLALIRDLPVRFVRDSHVIVRGDIHDRVPSA